MNGVYADWAPTLPTSWLVWLATGSVRLALYRAQNLHGPLRFLHVLATAGFFGAILVLDLRLIGGRRRVPGHGIAVGALARLVLPVVHACFAVLLVTGALLFLFDPIQTGSHGWFLPKLALVALGVANALLFTARGRGGTRSLGAGMSPGHARAAGLLSVLLWTGVIACATANQVERPLVRARALDRAEAPPSTSRQIPP